MEFNETNWTIEAEIAKRVELEDMVKWANTPTEKEDEAVLRKELPPTKSVGHGFPLQVWKYFQI